MEYYLTNIGPFAVLDKVQHRHYNRYDTHTYAQNDRDPQYILNQESTAVVFDLCCNACQTISKIGQTTPLYDQAGSGQVPHQDFITTMRNFIQQFINCFDGNNSDTLFTIPQQEWKCWRGRRGFCLAP